MENLKKDNGALRIYYLVPYGMSLVLTVATIAILLMDRRAGMITGAVLVLYVITLIWLHLRSRDHLLADLSSFASRYRTQTNRAMEQLDVPLAILDETGRVCWSDEAFAVLTGRKMTEQYSILGVFPELDLTRLHFVGKTEVLESFSLAHEDRIYRVCGRKLDFSEVLEETTLFNWTQEGNRGGSLLALYFYDETEFRSCQKTLEEDRLVVCQAYLDNFEEAVESTEDVRQALLMALVDRKISRYFSDYDAIVRKTEKDKYLLVMKQRSLLALQEQRFSILEEVKSVNIGNSAPVTLSLGVGTGGSSYRQNAEYARIAIEMALGRGGDQVVIKDGDEISYWGGKSLSPEKTTRVKARMKAQALKEFIEAKDRVVVMGHKITDVDALGAAIGIARAVMTMGKPVHIVVNDPTTSIRPLMEGFIDNQEYAPDMFVDSTQAKELVDDDTVVVVVDTNKPSYTECQELLDMTRTIVVLDHHRRGNEVIENAVLSYVEPYASSACEMVAEILQYFSDDLKLKSLEADCLYAGIVIDTNNFITRSGVRTFEAAAYLRRNGADITRVRKKLRDNIDSYKAKAEAVRTAEIYRDYFAIAVCPSEGLESPTVVGAQAANELLNIAGVKASFVLTSHHGEIFVSARAIDEVNVQILMEQLGGGGHLNVAGAQVKSSIQEVMDSIKAIIDKYMDEGGLKK